jgi:hypothetical protein
MNIIKKETFDEERALYGKCDILASECRFEGPEDGESAFKECRNIVADGCYFALRYPFWHTSGIKMSACEMTEGCRAALWYSEKIEISDSAMHGVKALRECKEIKISASDIKSPEFGWMSEGISIEKSRIEGEYAFLRAKSIRASALEFFGKYSFQYVENAVFENCRFETKDAFWHAKNVTVYDSIVNGEYLGWYSENLKLVRCEIRGTQPFCYCKNLELVDCVMRDADLAFEKSSVQATLGEHILSIKNPASGSISVPSVGEIIRDDENSRCDIIIGKILETV